MHDAPHKPTNQIKSNKILELLHVDLFGPPSHASLGGKKYCLVIVDDFSRYYWVYFFKLKSETQKTFIDFINLVQRQYNVPMLIIRSDNGTEFKNYTLNDFLSDEGIKHQYSAAYTPQQNGVSERKNRTLIEMARPCWRSLNLHTTFGPKPSPPLAMLPTGSTSAKKST